MRISFWLLYSAALFWSCGVPAQRTAVKNISETEMISMMGQKKVKVIDVRTDAEVKQGYIDGTSYFIDINSPNFNSEIKRLDPDVTYIVYCRSGGRSAKAADLMVSNGFKNVYNLTGGISNWKDKSRIKTQ